MIKQYLGIGVLLSIILAVSGCGGSTQTVEDSDAAVMEESKSVGDGKLHLGTTVLDWEYAVENLHQENLYIAKRLETKYEDTMVGAVKKELAHLEQTEESEWIVCDIEYLLDTLVPGDARAILRADYPDPFSEKGMYELNYIVLDETRTLVDQDGFTFEVPVYYMVSDMQAFYDGYEEFQAQKVLQNVEKEPMGDTAAGDSQPVETAEVA